MTKSDYLLYEHMCRPDQQDEENGFKLACKKQQCHGKKLSPDTIWICYRSVCASHCTGTCRYLLRTTACSLQIRDPASLWQQLNKGE